MYNIEIRKAIVGARLRYYEVAEAIGISPYTLSVWLRTELSGERLERVQAAIKKLSEKAGVPANG